jgi:GNAT superfamily N-acetyltransferase
MGFCAAIPQTEAPVIRGPRLLSEMPEIAAAVAAMRADAVAQGLAPEDQVKGGPPLRAVWAERNGQVTGVGVFFHYGENDSLTWIDLLYTAPEERRSGIARALKDAILALPSVGKVSFGVKLENAPALGLASSYDSFAPRWIVYEGRGE